MVYDWNVMEPLTFLACKFIFFLMTLFLILAEAFYLMVGSYYYLATRGDWVYTSVY